MSEMGWNCFPSWVTPHCRSCQVILINPHLALFSYSPTSSSLIFMLTEYCYGLRFVSFLLNSDLVCMLTYSASLCLNPLLVTRGVQYVTCDVGRSATHREVCPSSTHLAQVEFMGGWSESPHKLCYPRVNVLD